MVQPRVTFRGTNRLGLAAIRGREGAETGLRMAAEHVLGVSRTRVPIEEGTLERSGAATTDGLVAAVAYDTPYAARQHEELDWQHDPGRQAKYLESAANDSQAEVAAIIATATGRRLR